MELEERFNDYYESFKKLPPADRIKIINNELKEVLTYISKLNNSLYIKNELLYNREMFNIEKTKDNEDDFINSVFIYLKSIEESLASYMDAIYKILYKEEEKKND